MHRTRLHRNRYYELPLVDGAQLQPLFTWKRKGARSRSSLPVLSNRGDGGDDPRLGTEDRVACGHGEAPAVRARLLLGQHLARESRL